MYPPFWRRPGNSIREGTRGSLDIPWGSFSIFYRTSLPPSGGGPWILLLLIVNRHAAENETLISGSVREYRAKWGITLPPAPGKALRCVAELDSVQARQARLGETSYKSWNVSSPLVNKDSHVGAQVAQILSWPPLLWSLGAVVGWRPNWVSTLSCGGFRVRRNKQPGEVGWLLLFPLFCTEKHTISGLRTPALCRPSS